TEIRSTVDKLREDSGMDLYVSATVSPQVAQSLWASDRQVFLNDGATPGAASPYAGGLSCGLIETGNLLERIESLKAVSMYFDEPPAVIAPVPLGDEPDAAFWRELLALMAQAGIQRLTLLPERDARLTKTTLRHLRSQ